MRVAHAAASLAVIAMLVGCGGSGHPKPVGPRHGVAAYRVAISSAQASPRFFAPTSFWNAPLAPDAPTDPDSTALVATLLGAVREEAAGKWGPWISTTGFSTPIYTVPLDQPTVRVQLDNAQPALQEAFANVPLPSGAHPAAGRDAQLTVWQPASDRLWEFWRMRRETDGWHARWGGAMQHVSHSSGVFTAGSWPGANAHWGATSTSLPLVGGLITLEDIQRRRIDHALALGFPRIARGVVRWPAQRTDGSYEGPESIPAGTRFRLDPRLDLQRYSLPPLVLMIAEAAQRYGLVVRDTSGVVDFYGEDPTPTGSNPYRALFAGEYPWQQLERFPWGSLQALR